MSKGILVVISGPSGSGKGTVIKELMQIDGSFVFSVSVTTRNIRDGEQDGVDYLFRTKEEFIALRDSGQLLEYTSFVGNLYGTPVFCVEEQINLGKTVLFDIDVEGALQVKDKFPASVLIFLMPPCLDELKRRLMERGTEDEKTVGERMTRAAAEIEYKDKYDYVVVNGELNKAVAQINDIVAAEKQKHMA